MRSDAKLAEEAAGDWLALRDSGRWTDADEAGFDRWLNASTLNFVTYLRLEHGWEEARRLKALGAGYATDSAPPREQWVLSPFLEGSDARCGGGEPDQTAPGANERCAVAATRVGVRRIGWAVAAILVIAVGLGGWFTLWSQGRFITPVGGIASVSMADGSVVTLNTNTDLRVEVTKAERRVRLTQGEAYFEVAKDRARPFIVQAGRRQVVAVGTKFSVRRLGDDVQVVVTEGAVNVEEFGTSQAAVAALPAGTVARTRGDAVVVQEKSVQDLLDYVSWRDGVLVFRDATLGNAIVEFNRYNTRKIVIEDAWIAALRISGSFRSSNVDEFVWLLEQGYPLKAELHDDRVVIKRN